MMTKEMTARITEIIGHDDVLALINEIKKGQAILKSTNITLSMKSQIDTSSLNIMHVMALYNSIECFTYLVENAKVDIHIPSAAGYLPVHFAAVGGSLEVLSYIFSHFPNDGAIITETPFQLLILGIFSGSVNIVNLILEAGCDVDHPSMTSSKEKNPIYWSIIRNQHEILRTILKRCDSNYIGSLLIIALKRGESGESVPFLLSHGEDASYWYFHNNTFESPLSVACFQNDIKSVQLICDILGPKIVPPASSGCVTTPVHWAIESGNPEILRAILECGCDPNLVGLDGKHSLQVFNRKIPDNEKRALLSYLEMFGFDPNKPHYPPGLQVSYVEPILQSFLKRLTREPVIVDWLLAHGADVNALFRINDKLTGETMWEYAQNKWAANLFLKYYPQNPRK